MVGYKQPCRYCDELLPPNSNHCPYCSKINPLSSFRCPKCRNPVRQKWAVCSNCGQNLKTNCPKCGELTFFGDYCDSCQERLIVTCKNEKCKHQQAPIGKECIKCGKSI